MISTYPILAPRMRERGSGKWQVSIMVILSLSSVLLLAIVVDFFSGERRERQRKTNEWEDHRRTRFSSENKTHEKKPLSAFEKKNKIFFEFIYLPSSSLISLFLGETRRKKTIDVTILSSSASLSHTQTANTYCQYSDVQRTSVFHQKIRRVKISLAPLAIPPRLKDKFEIRSRRESRESTNELEKSVLTLNIGT